MDLESRLNRSVPRGESLRAIVPAGIVAFLGLVKGDDLVWRMEFVGDERVVFVTKKKKDSG
jgi:hypothetical protein